MKLNVGFAFTFLFLLFYFTALVPALLIIQSKKNFFASINIVG